MDTLTPNKIIELKKKANEIRKNIVSMLYESGSGHTAGALGMADIFTLLYFHALKHDPKRPNWIERDKMVVSNGHICPVLYATLAEAGYFPQDELKTLRKFGSRLQGHPDRNFLPLLETSSGPLGEGLSQAVGMALATRLNNDSDESIYCILSDGELDEGQSWEAIMLAAKEGLDNLIVIVDRNNIQIDGNTEKVMPLFDLASKWNSFNWHVEQTDGNDFEKLNNTFIKISKIKNKPKVIIANTIPGKGVKEFENNFKWHGKTPNKEETREALLELTNNL